MTKRDAQSASPHQSAYGIAGAFLSTENRRSRNTHDYGYSPLQPPPYKWHQANEVVCETWSLGDILNEEVPYVTVVTQIELWMQFVASDRNITR